MNFDDSDDEEEGDNSEWREENNYITIEFLLRLPNPRYFGKAETDFTPFTKKKWKLYSSHDVSELEKASIGTVIQKSLNSSVNDSSVSK